MPSVHWFHRTEIAVTHACAVFTVIWYNDFSVCLGEVKKGTLSSDIRLLAEWKISTAQFLATKVSV